mgnify:CR=1 FL=1
MNALFFERVVVFVAVLIDDVLVGATLADELADERPAARAASPAKPTGPLRSVPDARCGALRLPMIANQHWRGARD